MSLLLLFNASGGGYAESVTLARLASQSGSSLLQAAEAASLARSGAVSVQELAAFSDSLSLGRSAAVTETAQLAAADETTLSCWLGLLSADLAEASDTLSLAVRLGLAALEDKQGETQEVVTLAWCAGIAAQSELRLIKQVDVSVTSRIIEAGMETRTILVEVN
jgi:hypothetical protein